MAQILSVYGVVAAVIIANSLKEKMALYTGFMQFGAGLAVGLCGMAAGFAIGIVGDSGGNSNLPGEKGSTLANSSRAVRASTQQPRLYVGLVLILIFAEVLGLYGVVVSILMLTKSNDATVCAY